MDCPRTLLSAPLSVDKFRYFNWFLKFPLAEQPIDDKSRGKAGHLFRNERATILVEPLVGQFRGMGTSAVHMDDDLDVLPSRKTDGRS